RQGAADTHVRQRVGGAVVEGGAGVEGPEVGAVSREDMNVLAAGATHLVGVEAGHLADPVDEPLAVAREGEVEVVAVERADGAALYALAVPVVLVHHE